MCIRDRFFPVDETRSTSKVPWLPSALDTNAAVKTSPAASQANSGWVLVTGAAKAPSSRPAAPTTDTWPAVSIAMRLEVAPHTRSKPATLVTDPPWAARTADAGLNVFVPGTCPLIAMEPSPAIATRLATEVLIGRSLIVDTSSVFGSKPNRRESSTRTNRSRPREESQEAEKISPAAGSVSYTHLR